MSTLTKHLNPFFTDFGHALSYIDEVLEPQRQTYPASVQDNGDVYLVSAELPGYKKSDISVEINDGKLNITAEKDGQNQRKTSFSIKNDVDSKSISAKLEYGILTITLPKKEVTKPRKIKIQ